ncbi:MAG TPA: hypothetical protein VI864_04760 [Candidatus Bathyarchaeia archaeon]|nr:hypothetical protein [Candidatus Bathyarchaeia archaeon]
MTETERLMLVKKKETICGATLKILEMAYDPKNSLEIKKNFQYILEGLSTMATYSDSKNYDLNRFTEQVNILFDLMDNEVKIKIWILAPRAIGKMCNYANSINFNFTKKGFKLTLPKINLNIGNITNK